MATSAFKSTSRRCAAPESKASAASRRRSHSVSAVSRKTHVPFDDNTSISTEFSNSRDNPLFWGTSSSPPDKEESGNRCETATSNNKQSYSLHTKNTRNGNCTSNSVGEERGRSVTRSFSDKNGIGRSLSRVRGRSASIAPTKGVYESEREQDMAVSTIAQSRIEIKKIGNGMNKSSVVRNRVDKRGHPKNAGVTSTRNQATEWSEDDSACSLQISNFEDGVSIGSLSEAEEKTIKAPYEESNAFRRNNINTATATNVDGKPSDLVNPETVELISGIRREYSIQLEESEERARKLREDLAIEEHHGQELDRILKEIIPDPKTSAIQRSHRGRRTSNERKRMSKRLSEEAMAYFDECVSLSTFDSSDFSASEDPPYGSVGANVPLGASALVKGSPITSFCYDQSSGHHQKQIFDSEVELYSCEDSALTTDGSRISEPGSTQLYQFSFAEIKSKNDESEEDIRSYIKNFERGAKSDVDLEVSKSYYDAGEYSGQGHIESLLIDRVVHSSRIESGGLLLCGGAISFLPFASVV